MSFAMKPPNGGIPAREAIPTSKQMAAHGFGILANLHNAQPHG